MNFLYLFGTVIMLCVSNMAMLTAHYGHLKNKWLNRQSLVVIILVSWGIALFEYMFMIPANRLGSQKAALTLSQLKILQECITLAIFIPFSIFIMGEPITYKYFLAGLCITAAAYFIFT